MNNFEELAALLNVDEVAAPAPEEVDTTSEVEDTSTTPNNEALHIVRGTMSRKWGEVVYFDVMVGDTIVARVDGGHNLNEWATYQSTRGQHSSVSFSEDGNEVYFGGRELTTDYTLPFHLNDGQREKLAALIRDGKPALLWENPFTGECFASYSEAQASIGRGCPVEKISTI